MLSVADLAGIHSRDRERQEGKAQIDRAYADRGEGHAMNEVNDPRRQGPDQTSCFSATQWRWTTVVHRKGLERRSLRMAQSVKHRVRAG
jgi:hypothetical protein